MYLNQNARFKTITWSTCNYDEMVSSSHNKETSNNVAEAQNALIEDALPKGTISFPEAIIAISKVKRSTMENKHNLERFGTVPQARRKKIFVGHCLIHKYVWF